MASQNVWLGWADPEEVPAPLPPSYYTLSTLFSTPTLFQYKMSLKGEFDSNTR
jgi:hypothetical protein